MGKHSQGEKTGKDEGKRGTEAAVGNSVFSQAALPWDGVRQASLGHKI